MGKGAEQGRGFAPLRPPLPMPEQREGELTPPLLTLHSTAGTDFPAELDTNPSSNFNPQTKCELHEAECATSDYVTLNSVQGKSSCGWTDPVDRLPPIHALMWAADILPVGCFFVPAGGLSAMQPKMSSAPNCAANKHVQK